MTAPGNRVRAAPASGVRRVTAATYDHFDLACSECGMDSWSCSKLEHLDDRPFPLGKCCSACGEFDVHNGLGNEPAGRGSRRLRPSRERTLSSPSVVEDLARRGLTVLPVPNLG